MSKNKTIVIDIEAANAVTRTGQSILKDASEFIAYNTMDVFSVGRQTGKSMFNTFTMEVFKNRYYDTNLCKEIMMPMEPKPKYQFSRAKWHAAQLNGDGMWRLGQEYNEIIAWCNDTFGPHPKRSDAWSRWWVGIGQIYFRDEQDLVLYKLKWS